MTRARKLLLVLFLLLLLSQIPFAYRRYKLSRLSKTIQSLNSTRAPTPTDLKFTEYKGVVHVHSYLGGHTTGQFAEIIAAARANDLDFVVMTEHTERQVDTSSATLKGFHDGVLFLNGNEVSTANGDRVLAIPGSASFANPQVSVADVASRNPGGLTAAAYPDQFRDWNTKVDAIEIYNVFTNSKLINPVIAFFDTLWMHRSYPALMFANYYQRPNGAMYIWDNNLSSRKWVAIAGNDSHSNVGVQMTRHGRELWKFQVDPYGTSFQLVRVHALIPVGKELESTSLLEALKAGRCFIGFDLLGDTSGFRLTAINSTTGTEVSMGEEVKLDPGLKLSVSLPVSARVVLFKNGEVILDESDVTKREIPIREAGVYRVEVYQPRLGARFSEQPWIISNPIFVK